MPAQSSKRIQVGFSEVTLKAVEDLAEFESLKLSRVCSILIEEALIARGLLHSTKMGERMPSSLNPIIPDDAITPPDPEPLTPVNELLPPLTDDEKTKVIKETGTEPFKVNQEPSLSDQLNDEDVQRQMLRQTPVASIRNQLKHLGENSTSKLNKRDAIERLLALQEQQMNDRQEMINMMKEMVDTMDSLEVTR